METIFAFLDSIQPLSPQLREHLCNTLKVRQLTRKEYLLKAGHICRNVYFITKGLVRCYYVKETATGDVDISAWFMKEGDVIFSIESFYSQTESHEFIQALEDTTVFYISFEELEHIYQTYPEFNYTGRLLTIHYHKLWGQQLYSIRMKTAAERYQWLLHHYPELLLRVPAKFIASYLDISEITFSKIKAKKPMV